jgi:hypothetical protein
VQRSPGRPVGRVVNPFDGLDGKVILFTSRGSSNF